MKKLLSLVLALVMAIMPVCSFAETATAADETAVSADEGFALLLAYLVNLVEATSEADLSDILATISLPDVLAAAGLVHTADGAPAVQLTANDATLLTTPDFTYLLQGDGGYQLDNRELLDLLAAYTLTIAPPSITEEDLKILMLAFMTAFSDISAEAMAVTSSMNGSMLQMHLDLDALLKELEHDVAFALNAYKKHLDPIWAKLFGSVAPNITTDTIVEAWNQLGLSRITTGITADFTILEYLSQISIIGNVANWLVQTEFSEDGFMVKFTSPAGVAYVFDTADLPLMMDLLNGAMNGITEDAYRSAIDIAAENSSPRIDTYAYRLDPGQFVQDLLDGFAAALAANEHQANQLLEKYRPWLRFISPDAANSKDVAEIIHRIETIRVPETPVASLTITVNHDTLITGVEGEFDILHLSGWHYDGLSNSRFFGLREGSFTLRAMNDLFPVFTTLNYSASRSGSTSVTLTNSVMTSFGFQTLTFCHQGTYANEFVNIATDTDVFHLYLDNYGMDLKLGDMELLLDVTYDYVSVSLKGPRWYADARFTEDGLEIDTPVFGLHVISNSDYTNLSGYLGDADDRQVFSLSCNERQTSFDALWQTDDDDLYTLSLHGNQLNLTTPDDNYTLIYHPQKTFLSDPDVYSLLVNGETAYTIVVQQTETLMEYLVYQGTDTTAAPVATVSLNIAPEAVVLPENLQTVTLTEFMQLVNDLFLGITE